MMKFEEMRGARIGTQMFARDPADITFQTVADPVVSEKRGSYHTTPEQRQEKITGPEDDHKNRGLQEPVDLHIQDRD